MAMGRGTATAWFSEGLAAAARAKKIDGSDNDDLVEPPPRVELSMPSAHRDGVRDYNGPSGGRYIGITFSRAQASSVPSAEEW